MESIFENVQHAYCKLVYFIHITTALAIIGALIHPFVGIILPVIGVIIMTALVVAYEH